MAGGEHAVHLVLEEPSARVAQLGDAVGEEDDDVAAPQLDRLCRVRRERRAELHADGGLGEQQRPLDAGRAHDERRRVPGAGQLQEAAACADQAEQYGDEAFGVGAEIGLLEQAGTQLLEGLAGARRPGELAAVYRGPQDVLGDEGHGHRLHALAGHVSDGKRENARGAAVVVDEVAAAEHAGAGRAVARRRYRGPPAAAAPEAAGAAADARRCRGSRRRPPGGGGRRRPSRASAATRSRRARRAVAGRARVKSSSRSPTARKPEGAPCVAGQRHAGEALHPGDAGDAVGLVGRRRVAAVQERLRGEADDAGRALAGRPAAGRARPACADLVPGIAARRLAVEAACHPAARAGGVAGRFDGGAQHVGFAAGADEGRHVVEELQELVVARAAGVVERSLAGARHVTGSSRRGANSVSSLDAERQQGDAEGDIEAHADDADDEDDGCRPQQRAGGDAHEEAPPETEPGQAAAHARAAGVVVEIAGPSGMEHSGQLAAVARVQAALQRQTGLLSQHGVLSASEVLDQREEPVVGREVAALQAHLEVETVRGRVELDLRAPAAAVEERAQKPVEVGRDTLHIWSLRHAHAPIVPIASVIGSRPEEMKPAPDTVECRIRQSGCAAARSSRPQESP